MSSDLDLSGELIERGLFTFIFAGAVAPLIFAPCCALVRRRVAYFWGFWLFCSWFRRVGSGEEHRNDNGHARAFWPL